MEKIFLQSVFLHFIEEIFFIYSIFHEKRISRFLASEKIGTISYCTFDYNNVRMETVLCDVRERERAKMLSFEY